MVTVIYFFTLIVLSQSLFFGGGGGCECRPQQCGCSARPVCPPSPCGRSFPQPYFSQYRPPPPPFVQTPNYYQVPHQQPIPIQSFPQSLPYNNYQSPPTLLTSSYNAPPYSTGIQNTPIQVSSAKETSEPTYPDTVIQKSKTLNNVKNELDEDVSALSNFETSLLAYKSMNRNGIRRAQGTKVEKPNKCTSSKLQEIMEKAMSKNVSVSKLKISQGAKREFGYNFDVICSEFDFSYLISSSIYCRVEVDGQTCLAYEN